MRAKLFHTTFLLVFLFGFLTLHAQESDRKNAYRCFKLFENYEYTNVDLAKTYVDSGLYYAKKTKSSKILGRAYQYMGWYYQDQSKFSKANELFYKSLAYLRKANDEQGIADAYGNLGNSYFDMKDYQKALDFQLLSLSQNEKILKKKTNADAVHNALQGQTYALHNIGTIYSSIGMYDKALEYEYRSLPYEIKSGNKHGESISYNMLAILYSDLGKVDSAVYYYKKALTIAGPTMYQENYATTLQGYATLENSGLSKVKRASILRESLEIRRDLGDVSMEAKVLLDICESEFDELEKDSLSSLFSMVNALIENNPDLDPLKEKYYQLYARYASKKGDFDKAYFSLENFVELKALSDEKRRVQDLIAGDIKRQLLTKNFNDSIRIENNFAVERAEYHKELSEIQNIVYLSVIGFIILIGALTAFITTSRRRKRINLMLTEKNELIQEQKAIVEEKNQSISDSINYAERLQRAILPTKDQFNTYLPDSFLVFLPKDVVSGDFYWMEEKNGVIYTAVADCTGHGVPGAMMSVVCSDALSRAVNEFQLLAPKDILDKTRDLVIRKFERSDESVSDGMDISLISIDLESKALTFAGANNSLYVIRPSLSPNEPVLIELKGDKQPIGNYAHKNDFSQQEMTLLKGDVLYLFSDGFADQFGGPDGKKFKYAPFKKELATICQLPMHGQQEYLEKLFFSWKGNLDQIDDVCILGIRV